MTERGNVRVLSIVPLAPGLQGPAAEAARGAGAEIVGGSELIEKVQCLLQHALPFCQILSHTTFLASLHCVPLCLWCGLCARCTVGGGSGIMRICTNFADFAF